MKNPFKKVLFSLLLTFAMSGLAGVSKGSTVLLSENFSSGSMPAGWSQDSASVMPYYVWSFSNPGLRIISGSSFDSQFVIFDSDFYGQNNSEDAYLNLPPVNASSLSSLFLVMDEQYQDWTNGFHQIEISTNGGASWTSIVNDSDATNLGYPNAVRSVYNITSIAAGQSSVSIRFHYAATYGYWWAIDNVEITDTVLCVSPPYAGNAFSNPAFACPSSSFTLMLDGTSGGIGEMYQWQSSPDGVTWTDIPGATTIPFTTTQASASYYQCVVTCSGLSSPSFFTYVYDSPDPGYSISNHDFLCPGGSDSLTLSLSIGNIAGYTYQWQSSPDNFTWTDILGATTDTYSLTQASPTYYQCIISCGGSFSTSYSVFVGDIPYAGYTISQSTYLCAGGIDTLSLSIGNVSGLSYQWQSSADSVTWTDITGATSATYPMSQTAANYYQCVVTCGGSSSTSIPVFVSGAPDAGIPFSTLTSFCVGDVDTLTLSLGSIPGIFYQWQSSSDSLTWTNINGANSPMYVFTPSAAGYFHCVISCGTVFSTSSNIYLALNPNPHCYCWAQNRQCDGTDEITNVTVNALNNSSACDTTFISNFVFYPASTVTTTLSAGSTYNLSVTTNNDNIISAWIDFNQDGSLDASEWFQVCTTSVPDTANVVSITIPNTAINGLTVMRVRSRYSGNPNGAGDACLEMGSGETEDYEVTIINGINAVAENNFVHATIYPSPTSGLFTIALGQKLKSAAVTITDVMGREIKSFIATQNNISVDLSSQSNGIYFVKLSNENSQTVRKIILNK